MRRAKSYVAGMDGNRTHPGRLSSAPQTVLKTAGVVSAAVRQRSPTLDRLRRESMIVRHRPRLSVGSAVALAVTEHHWPIAIPQPITGRSTREPVICELTDPSMSRSRPTCWSRWEMLE